MLSAGQTLMLDFLRKGRRQFLLLQPLAIPLWPLLLHQLLARMGDLTPRDLRFIFFMTLLMETLTGTVLIAVLQVGASRSNPLGGFPARLYTLPVSTARLLFWHFLPALLFIVLIHLYTAAFLRLLTGVWPPLLEPAFFMAAIYAWSAAIFWALPGFAVLRLLALAAVGYLLGSWAVEAYKPYDHQAGPGLIWAPASVVTLLWLAAAIAAAWGVALAGLRRDRRGDSPAFSGVKALWLGLFDRLPRRERRFASPQAAQFWMERRLKGWIMPAGALLIALIIVGIWLGGGVTEVGAMLTGLIGLQFYYVVPAAFLAGILMGRGDLSGRASGLDLFRATRPLSDFSLAAAMHKTAVYNILVSSAVCLASALLATAGMALAGQGGMAIWVWQAWAREFGEPGLGLWSYPSAVLLSMLVAWVLISLPTALGQAGHGRLLARICVGFIALITSTVVFQFFISPEMAERVVKVSFFTVGVLFLLGGAWALLAAGRRRLVGPRLTALFATVWLALLVTGVSLLFKNGLHEHWANGNFMLGGLTLAAATPSLGALAIAWNRHR